MRNITIFTPEGSTPDQGAIEQLKNCITAATDEDARGVLCADHHLGYSMPIGGAVAYENYISPAGVGYDIGCGVKGVATSLFWSDIRSDIDAIAKEISRRVSFGVGRPNNEPADHPIIDAWSRRAPITAIKQLHGLAAKQLGTVGAGNHYVDLMVDRATDRVWITCHFGSRGVGHKIASGFLAMAQGMGFSDHAPEGEKNAPPVLLRADSSLGHTYIEAMKLAGDYAYAGRDVVASTVLDILGNPDVVDFVHNHHNFAWQEEHGDRMLWVVRKGCTPAWPGERGVVGGSMGDDTVIIQGHDLNSYRAEDAVIAGDAALWSAPHGAGRAMSRTKAKGKQRKRFYCRSCGWEQGKGVAAPPEKLGSPTGRICPSCRSTSINKKWVTLQEGAVNWTAVRQRLAEQGIVVVGGDADEAPEAYKRLPEVIEAHADYVDVTHTLRPVAVVMAGANTYDPFKD